MATQQLAVSPIPRHKMISQKSHIIQRTISFPSAHLAKQKQCPMQSAWFSGSGNDFTSLLRACQRGTKGCDVIELKLGVWLNHIHGWTGSQVLATALQYVFSLLDKVFSFLPSVSTSFIGTRIHVPQAHTTQVKGPPLAED